MIVAFAGSSFDMPVLRPPPVHIDLRHVLKRLGFSSGLKRIEQLLEITRPPQVQGLVDGFDALRL